MTMTTSTSTSVKPRNDRVRRGVWQDNVDGMQPL
jgi:hypothetical protein